MRFVSIDRVRNNIFIFERVYYRYMYLICVNLKLINIYFYWNKVIMFYYNLKIYIYCVFLDNL